MSSNVLRVPDFFISYCIPGIEREPNLHEYRQLKDANDEYFTVSLQKYCEKHHYKFTKMESEVGTTHYQEKIPDNSYEVCLKYTFADFFFEDGSELPCMDEILCQISTSLRKPSYIKNYVKAKLGEDSPFYALKTIFFENLDFSSEENRQRASERFPSMDFHFDDK